MGTNVAVAGKRSFENTRFREGREVLGFTLEDVAEFLEVSPGLVTMWEDGDAYPAPEELSQLARLYRRSPEWLAGKEADAKVSDELLASVETLSADDKDKVLAFARFLASTSKA